MSRGGAGARGGVWRRVAAGAALAVLAVACDQTGSAITRIDEAEAEILELTATIAEAVSLETNAEPELGRRRECSLPTHDDGATNALSLRGALPDVDDPIGRASAILVEAGYQLIDSEEELGEGVFGRRDGIRITVVVDAAVDQLAIDAGTGCRPLPRG